MLFRSTLAACLLCWSTFRCYGGWLPWISLTKKTSCSFLSCVCACVSVSGVLFSVGVRVCVTCWFFTGRPLRPVASSHPPSDATATNPRLAQDLLYKKSWAALVSANVERGKPKAVIIEEKGKLGPAHAPQVDPCGPSPVLIHMPMLRRLTPDWLTISYTTTIMLHRLIPAALRQFWFICQCYVG